MTTWRELIYLVFDELKLNTNEAPFTEEHVALILSKHRSFVLKQKYGEKADIIPFSNYQTLKIELLKQGSSLISRKEIPNILTVSKPKAILSITNTECSYTTPLRFAYVGNNRFLKNMTYFTIDNDSILKVKSNNLNIITDTNHKFIFLTSIFEDAYLSTSFSGIYDEENKSFDNVLDMPFPIEESLISTIVDLTIKELSNAIYKPADTVNDDKDLLSDLASYLRRNLKTSSTPYKSI